MMKLVDAILLRISSMSRAMQWATYAAIVFVAFFIWDSTINALAQDWKMRGDQIVEDARKLESGSELASKYHSVDRVASEIGEIELPQLDKIGAERLHKAVNEVLAKHSFTDVNYDQSIKGRMTSDEGAILKSVPNSSGKSVTAISGELQFDATLEQAIQIISDLEDRPEISCVSSVRLLRDKSKKVKVRVTVESWVLSNAGGTA
ncbi:MAG TPA: hypothetical protein VG711_08615 [Phycisphaerales bacterium]|nr:hypothetical protein [Phycisphaerales bacterium]